MNKKMFLFLFCLIFINIVNAYNRINPQTTADSLLITRCKSICSIGTEEDMMNCDVEKCVKNSNKMFKYGNCPAKQNNNNKLESLCIDVCNGQDYKCSDIQKCCSHQCGKSCQEPELDNFEKNDDLPPIPHNIILTETEFQNVNIEFDLISTKKIKLPILYIIETRAHIGKIFTEYKLGDWKWITFQHRYDTPMKYETFSTRTVGQIKLRVGRWYQFRVAAVNENGTRGYSTISKEFQLKDIPKLQKPKFLKINKIFLKDSTYNINIKWSSPKSDLPIEKYKISWSLFLQRKIKNHSLWMEHKYVFEPQRSYEITKLLPNSSYYIQVQSIAVYGKKRLISDKKSKIVNTTFDELTSHLDNNKDTNENRFDDNKDLMKAFINVSFIPDMESGFLVRLVWDKYLDKSKTILDLCQGADDESCFKKKSKKEFQSVVILKDNNYEFTNLRFSSYYTARLKQFGKHKSLFKSLVKKFYTPSCTNFKRKYSHLNLDCEK